jgi:O-antigen ligase
MLPDIYIIRYLLLLFLSSTTEMVKYFLKFNHINLIAILFGVFILVPFKLKPFLVFFSLVYVLFNYTKTNYKPYLFFLIYYLVVLLTLFYCNNLENGINLLIRLLPFIIMPLFFSILKKDELTQLKHNFIRIFIYSNFIYSILIWAYLMFIRLTTPLRTLDHLLSYITNEFYGLNDHPIYISCFLGISLIFLLLKEKKNKTDYFILVFLLLTLILLSRKMVLLALFGIILLRIFQTLKNTKQLFFLASLLLFSLLIVLQIPEVSQRFLEIFNFNQIDKTTSTGTRIIIWEIIFDLILNNLFFGISWGDTQNLINSKLVALDLNTLINKNAHNQYLQILLSSGVFGFFIITYFYIQLFIKNYQKNIYFTLTQTLFLIVFLIENFIERQNGIIIFVFITCLFVNKKN